MTILSEILNGDHDAILDQITKAVQERREWRGRTLLYAAQKGDRVRISQNVRPKYLAGITGVITHIGPDKATIDVGHARGRFGRIINIPPALIEKE